MSGPYCCLGVGGTVTEFTDAAGIVWKVHSFTNVGTSTFTATSDISSVEYLIVGGGGRGGANNANGSGGGGGGGGVYTNIGTSHSQSLIVGTSCSISVGDGGNMMSREGGTSSITFGRTTISQGGGAGGGAGGSAGDNASNGGSGGGAGTSGATRSGGTVSGVTINGVVVIGNVGANSSGFSGGGGGGKNSAGKSSTVSIKPDGGSGFISYIRKPEGEVFGKGGNGGDANYETLQSGAPNSGNGGDGLPTSGGALNYGGSGIVIIRYKVTERAPATGGIPVLINDGTNKFVAHIFNASGEFKPEQEVKASYLVVGGGGGGGGFEGGGGGGGGVLYDANYATSIPTSGATITVGNGGFAGEKSGSKPLPMNGSDSRISVGITTIITSIGGGAGAHFDNSAKGGGSGGGGNSSFRDGGKGTTGQGTNGQNYSSGGGGAAQSGNGGGANSGKAGRVIDITGASNTYGSGGAGDFGGNRNLGGTNAGDYYNGTLRISGVPNTGGGGAGGSGVYSNPGNGGSGIVVIRYEIKDPRLIAAEDALKEFYVNTFLPAKPIGIFDTTTQAAVATAKQYINDGGTISPTLKAAGLSTWTTVTANMLTATKTLLTTVIDKFGTSRNYWQGMGMTLTADISNANVVTDAATVGSATTFAGISGIRNTYVNVLWPALTTAAFTMAKGLPGASTNVALDQTKIDECASDTSIVYNYGRTARTGGTDWLDPFPIVGTGTTLSVRVLVRNGDFMYVGCDSATITGVLSTAANDTSSSTITVNRIFRYNLNTKRIHTLGNGITSGGAQVYAIAISGDFVYVGGSFTTLQNTAGGTTISVRNFARFNLSNSTWEALNFGSDTGAVRAIAIIGSNVYIGGEFAAITRTPVGTSTAVSSRLAVWTSSSFTAVPGLTGNQSVFSLVTNGSILYVGGAFGNRLVAFDTTATVPTTIPKLKNTSSISTTVYSMAIYNSQLYIGAISNFFIYDLLNESIVASFTLSNPSNTAIINATTKYENTLFVGGSFTTIAGTSISKLARLDLTKSTLTFEALPNPGTTTTDIGSMLATCNELFIGRISNIGGTFFRYWDKTYTGTATSHIEIPELFYTEVAVQNNMTTLYKTLYLPGIRYLSTADTTVTAQPDLSAALKLCTDYFLKADGTPKDGGYVRPPGSISDVLSTLNRAIIAFVQKLLDRYIASKAKWNGYGLGSSVPDYTATTVTISNYDRIASDLLATNSWPKLVSDFAAFLRNQRIAPATNLQNWYKAALGAPATVNGKPTTGLGK